MAAVQGGHADDSCALKEIQLMFAFLCIMRADTSDFHLHLYTSLF
jgi:hypothetical protein